jgi:hypothetical protein
LVEAVEMQGKKHVGLSESRVYVFMYLCIPKIIKNPSESSADITYRHFPDSSFGGVLSPNAQIVIKFLRQHLQLELSSNSKRDKITPGGTISALLRLHQTSAGFNGWVLLGTWTPCFFCCAFKHRGFL